jgi:hypothetical protein
MIIFETNKSTKDLRTFGISYLRKSYSMAIEIGLIFWDFSIGIKVKDWDFKCDKCGHINKVEIIDD